MTGPGDRHPPTLVGLLALLAFLAVVAFLVGLALGPVACGPCP